MCPGPSASAADAERIHAAGIPIGAVGCAYQLAPFASFVASSDAAWWKRYPDAMAMACPKYAMHPVGGTGRIKVPTPWAVCNSGVLGLECAKQQGATEILLMGADMHGTHFFGPYDNGLTNTNEKKRKTHARQYEQWARANAAVRVINITPGSALTCFPMSTIEAEL